MLLVTLQLLGTECRLDRLEVLTTSITLVVTVELMDMIRNAIFR